MVVGALAFFVTALQARAVEDGGVGRLVRAEQVDGDAVVEVQVTLDGGQVDHTGGAHAFGVVGLELVHHFAGTLDGARNTGFAHEHVVGFFGQHELGGAGQRIEAGLGQRAKLELAVAVGEVGEHVERQPVGRLFVEGPQDARIVRIAGAALQQRVGFLAAVAAEIAMQQVHHGPQVAAFFHVDLEQVAQVVLGRRGQAQMALLLDRSGFGVALRDDDAAQIGAVFAGHVLPHVPPHVFAEVDLALAVLRRQKDAPAVIGHFDVVEMRPAVRFHADRRAQVYVETVRAVRPHVLPPLQIVGLPMLQRALQGAVAGQIDVIGDLVGVVDAGHCLCSCSWDGAAYGTAHGRGACGTGPPCARPPWP
ncbi:hypothetical protein D3C86_693660 [compost metagenome]